MQFMVMKIFFFKKKKAAETETDLTLDACV